MSTVTSESIVVGRGSASYAWADAEAVLAGFAFGKSELSWPVNFTAPTTNRVGDAPRAAERYKWSYRIYDCVASSPYAFEVSDILVLSALDAGAAATEFLEIEAILPELDEVLSLLDVAQPFWTLPRGQLGTSPPPERTPAWCLWRAWALVKGLDNVGVAITYKLLHHKRPWFFPNFDNDTLDAMGGRGAWQVLYDELMEQKPQFVQLEQWFASQALQRGGVPLTRLRIHDILLWAAITRNGTEREHLVKAGAAVLGRR